MRTPVSLILALFTLCQAVKIATDYLDEAGFNALVQGNDPLLAILHEGDDCTDPICEKFNQVVPGIKQELVDAGYKIGASSSPALLKKYGVKKAELLFVRSGRPAVFKGSDLDADSLIDWMQMALLTKVQSLNEDDFEHLTQAATGATTGDWLVLFHGDDYSSKEPVWESLAIRLKGKVIVATVDITKNAVLKKRFNIMKSPTVVLFRHGNMYTYSLSDLSFESLAAFGEGWYKNEKAVKVPLDPSPFDELTENIARYLKTAMKDPKNHMIAVASVGTVAVVVLVLVACTCMPSKSKAKAD